MLKVLKKRVRRWRKRRCRFLFEGALVHDGERFVEALNSALAWNDAGVRFFYDKEKRAYGYVDERYGLPIYFFHKTRSKMYRNGIIHRVDSLARDYFLSRIKFTDGDVVLDCGANIGELYFWFKFNDLRVRYVAFEPSPLEFSALRMNCPNADAHNVALWNRNETIPFYLASEDADSSIIQPAQHQGSIAVEGRRLEAYIEEPIRLLKLEAEGAEPEILEGIGDKLRLIEYISADLGFERGVNCESTLVPVTNMLLRNNFSLVEVGYPRVVALFKNDRPSQ